MAIGKAKMADLRALDQGLRADFADPDALFDQVIVQVGTSLRYEELMKVMEVCARQKLHSGKKLTKLSFVELPSGPGGGK